MSVEVWVMAMDIILGYYTYNPKYLSTLVSELFIHFAPLISLSPPRGDGVRRGFDKGSISVPKGYFALFKGRSVPLVSITYKLSDPFHGGNRGSNPLGDAK